MKKILAIFAISMMVLLTGCYETNTQEAKDRATVQHQQEQFAKNQPIPTYKWSLERDLLIQLYNTRNTKVATYSVWRSDTGIIEDHCPSIGYGIPYDTSLTNPVTPDWYHNTYGVGGVAIEQAEPNGIFASKNSVATWVMCVTSSGAIEPISVESKVTTYPYQVTVDFEKNRVTKSGESSFQLKIGQ